MIKIESIAASLPVFLGSNTYSSIWVLVDTNTKKHCYAQIKGLLPKHKIITIGAGEAHKNLETCQKIWKELTDGQTDRHALLINLGGGVIGDMGGFCAALYKRGIDFIQIPTTLLSQVDASVGGKLGIDFEGLKNHSGVFNIPNAVLIDADFLKTLPLRELRSGFAEVIKHCLIADANMWQTIRTRDMDEQNIEALIAHSVAIKQKIVEADPTEKGLRKILNFGHTLGHAVETFFLHQGKKCLLHGEAIAVGMIMEAYLSYKKGFLSESELMDIEAFLFATYGNVTIAEADIEAIINLTLQDKKNRAGKVRFSLLDGIGKAQYDVVIGSQQMKEAIQYYMG